MNPQFDELTKNLAQSVTRRAALKKFGVGLAGMALACFGLATKAKANPKRMIFAEGEEEVVLRAAIQFRDFGYGTPVLVGRPLTAASRHFPPVELERWLGEGVTPATPADPAAPGLIF